jgi:hypothetical protein
MTDFHVEYLQYSVQPHKEFIYKNPPPLRFETEEARFMLAEGILRCEMKLHFSDREEARKAVEPILRSWEAYTDLRQNRGQLRFRFEKWHVVDRSPSPTGAIVVRPSPAIARTSASLGSLHATIDKYPEPPPVYFRLNPDAQTVLQRYQGYGDKHEPLHGMAYFNLTMLERLAGGGKNARKKRPTSGASTLRYLKQ